MQAQYPVQAQYPPQAQPWQQTQPPLQEQPPQQLQTIPALQDAPYVPFQNSWDAGGQAGGYANGYPGQYAGPTVWNTAWGWILALSPVYFFGLFVASVLLIINRTSTASPLNSSPGAVALGGLIILGAILLIVFAVLDYLRLKALGYTRTASWGWVFLTPLVYLIIRTVRVYGETRRGIAPVIVHGIAGVVGFVAYLVVSAVVALSLSGGAGALGTSSQFSAGLVRGLDEKGGSYSATCPPIIPSVVGSTFSCTATDTTTNTVHTLNLEVVTGTNGKPTVRLVSVVPPISH